MSPHTRSIPKRSVVSALLCLLTFGSLQSQTEKLKENSPFLPKGYGQEKPEPVQQPVVTSTGPISQSLEFRGVMKWGGDYQYSLFDKKENKGYWVSEGEAAANGISARNFDTENMTLMVTMGGRTERLTLMSATDSPLPVTASKPNTGASPGTPQIPTVNNRNTGDNDRRTVVPRRRVILPRN